MNTNKEFKYFSIIREMLFNKDYKIAFTSKKDANDFCIFFEKRIQPLVKDIINKRDKINN